MQYFIDVLMLIAEIIGLLSFVIVSDIIILVFLKTLKDITFFCISKLYDQVINLFEK